MIIILLGAFLRNLQICQTWKSCMFHLLPFFMSSYGILKPDNFLVIEHILFESYGSEFIFFLLGQVPITQQDVWNNSC